MSTKLQKIATQRNWFKWFIVKPIQISCLRDLQLSDRTKAKIASINNEVIKLRELVDRDWEAQKKKLTENPS